MAKQSGQCVRQAAVTDAIWSKWPLLSHALWAWLVLRHRCWIILGCWIIQHVCRLPLSYKRKKVQELHVQILVMLFQHAHPLSNPCQSVQKQSQEGKTRCSEVGLNYINQHCYIIAIAEPYWYCKHIASWYCIGYRIVRWYWYWKSIAKIDCNSTNTYWIRPWTFT